MQYLVTMLDGTDADAPARRAAVRPRHLARAEQFQHAGNLLIGGALLDEAGHVIGSAAVVQFHSRAALDEWINNDPFFLEGVWQNITVQPYRVAPHYNIAPLSEETH
ncbi:YciI family protein [Xanthobacter sp. TB0136]|uniref:YciI family protein n=1 Tax=Xanthobacter sp. TB0136 TaxID=3459177 RepID=UPI0040393836